MDWVSLINKKVVTEDKGHPHCPEEKANLFHTFDFSSTEIETLNLLHALVLLIKPTSVLETGTFYGYGSIAIGSALKENGVGHLITLENTYDICKVAKKNIEDAGLIKYITLLYTNSLDYINATGSVFDLAFFDSAVNIRTTEFNNLYKKQAVTNLVAFHDTSELREKTLKKDKYSQAMYTRDLKKIADNYCTGNITFSLSRGLKVFQLNK